jgi:SMC interacting uncharacterized protein involved in chromosome segregation
LNAKTKAIINELAHQRNQYMDACAQLSGEIAERDEKIATLQSELDAMKAKSEPATSPAD